MVAGMVLGAWLHYRGGWFGLWVGAGTVALLSILDGAFGLEVGRYLGESLRDVLLWGAP